MSRPRVITILVVGNIVMAVLAVALLALLAVPMFLRGPHGGWIILIVILLICALYAASIIRAAHGLWTRKPYGSTQTRNLIVVPMALCALGVGRAVTDLTDKGTTEWEFAIPCAVVLALGLTWQWLLRRPVVRQWEVVAAGDTGSSLR